MKYHPGSLRIEITSGAAHWDGIENMRILTDRMRIAALVCTGLNNILFILQLLWRITYIYHN